MRLALPTGRGRWRLKISDCIRWPVPHLLTGGAIGTVLVHHVIVVIAQPQLHRCEARPALHAGKGRQALVVSRPGDKQATAGPWGECACAPPGGFLRNLRLSACPAPSPGPSQALPDLQNPICIQQDPGGSFHLKDGEFCTGAPDPLTQDVAKQPCLEGIIGQHAADTQLGLTHNLVKKKVTTVKLSLPHPNWMAQGF